VTERLAGVAGKESAAAKESVTGRDRAKQKAPADDRRAGAAAAGAEVTAGRKKQGTRSNRRTPAVSSSGRKNKRR
jgi:hypothetical protein